FHVTGVQTCALPISEEYQMNVFAPKAVLKAERSRHSVYANVFMGNPNDEVLFRINEGEWKKMKFTNEEDPKYQSNFYKWDLSERSEERRVGKECRYK